MRCKGKIIKIHYSRIPEDFQIEEESTEDLLRRRPSDRRKADEDTGESNLSKSWGFRKDFRGSDRRRKVSNIQEGEPSRGTSSLRFQVPSRPGRKPSTTETPTKTTTISAPQGREAIVYSPASSSFSMASVSSNRGSTPCSDMFFASGNFKTQLSFENVNNLKNNYTFLRDLKVYNNNIFYRQYNSKPYDVSSPDKFAFWLSTFIISTFISTSIDHNSSLPKSNRHRIYHPNHPKSSPRFTYSKYDTKFVAFHTFESTKRSHGK